MLKLGSGVLMVVGIWYPPAALVAGLVLVVLMGGAIAMHAKIRDPLLKWMPATLFFLLSCYVVYVNAGPLVD